MVSRTSRILLNSVRGMARNRLRTFFMMLGTFVGVAALTVILAIGRGTQQDVMDKLGRMLGGSTILLRAGGGQVMGGAHSGGPTTTLTLDDVRAIQAEVHAVQLADPMVFGGTRDIDAGGGNRTIRVEGHSEAAEVVWNRSVTRGAYFTAADVASAARVALVGEGLVPDLFAGRDPVGEQIRIGGVPFRVTGVLEHAGIDPHGIDLDREIIIPISTMMRRVVNIDYVMGAKFGLTPGTNLDLAVLEITDVLRRRHALSREQPADFQMFTPVQVQGMVRSANRVFTVFLPLIAAVSILIGGLVVANLMLMTVNERRWEIGLRKAVGARARDIRLQFLVESAAVTGLGGLLALIAGVAVLQGLARVMGTPAAMPWSVALLGLGAAMGVGIIAGVVPARRAAALDPVQTLR
jgi:ABC-type antimicrobial peptide transport system permease subunit